MHFVWSWDQERQSPGQLSQKKRILTGIGKKLLASIVTAFSKKPTISAPKKSVFFLHKEAGFFFCCFR